jgi:dGTPase
MAVNKTPDWGSIEKEIIANNKTREERTLSPFACKSISAVRFFPEEVPDETNIRPAFFHDTDRIIHSMAYTRYIDKTQVFFLFENDHITHRVLHVQLVSKIARTIGRFLRLNEDLIEAIALGHDIGHAPFGHDGEYYLDRLCQENDVGHFRHNAQSVKFLMEIEQRGNGLNLTLQVLDGILCHNGEFISECYQPAPEKSWSVFFAEYNRCWHEGKLKGLKPFTLEGCVVRVSDVIAYIGRDIEDAISVNLISRGDIPEEITAVLGTTNREIVDHLIKDLIKNSFDKNYLRFSPKTLNALLALREFNFRKIYLNPRKQTQNSKIENMFRLLFQKYLSCLQNEDLSSAIYTKFLNHMKAEYREKTAPERIVVDFISGMTDAYFQNQFKELFFPKSFGATL